MEFLTDTSFIYIALIGGIIALSYIWIRRKRVK